MTKEFTIEQLARRRDDEQSNYGVTGEADVIVPQEMPHEDNPILANLSMPQNKEGTPVDEKPVQTLARSEFMLYFGLLIFHFLLSLIVVISGLIYVGVETKFFTTSPTSS